MNGGGGLCLLSYSGDCVMSLMLSATLDTYLTSNSMSAGLYDRNGC